MKILITGGTGFIGFRLANRLLEKEKVSGPDGQLAQIDEMVLFDALIPDTKPAGLDERISIVAGDISDEKAVSALVDRDDISIFHLASVVSGGGEQDFDLAMRVNLDGGRNVLEAARGRASTPRVVFASSIAAFGGDHMPKSVGDDTKQNPQTTYGMTKAIGELMINDYTRKGFIDGRSARLPTVIIRPGKPNAAASSFVSGVFREPLNGVDFTLPVKTETVMPLLGYRAIVDGIIALHELTGEKLGTDRALSLPALTVTVEEMIAALIAAAGNRPLGQISVEPDPFIEEIVATWPLDTHYDRAAALGLPRENSLEEIVRYYIADYLEPSE
ncbi:MAG: D-erythronate dehydrogenase [Hyphomicrobiales bacterium]